MRVSPDGTSVLPSTSPTANRALKLAYIAVACIVVSALFVHRAIDMVLMLAWLLLAGGALSYGVLALVRREGWKRPLLASLLPFAPWAFFLGLWFAFGG